MTKFVECIDMEKEVYRIGGETGYRAYVDLKTRNVVAIDYYDWHEGGTLRESEDGEKECDYSVLKSYDEEVFKDVIKFKETGELPQLYAWFNGERQETIPFDYHEINWECNKKMAEKVYIPEGRVLKEVPPLRFKRWKFGKLDKKEEPIKKVETKQKEEIQKPCKTMQPEYRRALILTNLAFVLADTVNLFVYDAEQEMKKLNKSFRHEDKMNFSKMRNALKMANAASIQATREIFGIKDADSATHDAEWYYELLMLCVDRIGENDVKATKLMSWLKNMDSEEQVIVE